MNIKPIETVYKGYRFRSRLEARWAVFFEVCGAHYRYENEGFQLTDGSYYLPDFEVECLDEPGLWWFIECKGHNDPEGIRKAQLLDNNPPDNFLGVMILTEPPDPTDAYLYWPIDFTKAPGMTFHMALRLGIPYELAVKAATKARQARFEHGEAPII